MPKGVYTRVKKPIAERFWARVKKTDTCWLWQGYLNRKGYGNFAYPLRSTINLAHRVAWALTHGGELPSLCVLHRCDTPACVRPSHLFLGTVQENNADMVAKGRHRPWGHHVVC